MSAHARPTPTARHGLAVGALLLAGFLGPHVAGAQTPAPTPAPAHCEILGLPACAEAGKAFQATVQVNNAAGNPVPGAQVIVGTGLPTTTNNGGQATVSGNCGQAGSSVSISVRVNGQVCATATVNCYKRDKSGDWIIDAAKVVRQGSAALDQKDILSASTQLTYGGLTFEGPQPETFAMTTTTKRLLGGLLKVTIDSYLATYPAIEVGPFSAGETVVKLKPNSANYLVINPSTGVVFGYMQTTVDNSLFSRPQERHLQFTGTLAGDILELGISGFLIETGKSDAVFSIDAWESETAPKG